MVGEIHLAKIYFTDLSTYKIRPILIIKVLGDDLICLQISSQIKKDRILIDRDDLIDGVLKKKSMIVVPKNFTLHRSVLSKYIDKINKKLFQKIYKKFCNELGCNR